MAYSEYNLLTLTEDYTECTIIGSRNKLNKIDDNPLIKLGDTNMKRIKQ